MRFEFGEFVLDTEARELQRGAVAVRLSPKAFHLLEVLVAARPRALGKQELMEEIWPDTFVVEANLSNLIGELRSALDDAPRQPRFVRTVHRFGYAFLDGATPGSRRGGLGAWHAHWAHGRVELPEGTHLCGRGDQTIRVEARSVSRAHARVVVSQGRLTYEDLGSKNGSFRDGQPIAGVVDVRSGDVITVGAVAVTFSRTDRHTSTETVDRLSLGGVRRPRRR
jgi:Transcriptional regulatory protein, C terminal/FHA domain